VRCTPYLLGEGSVVGGIEVDKDGEIYIFIAGIRET
jgi:hypothetical protein